jgi:hypothetical protein
VFQEYSLQKLLQLANDLNRRWSLGLPNPLTSDHVTRLRTLPKTNGISGSIVIAHRYSFSFADGKFESFADLEYWMNAYEGKPEKFKQRANAPNLLTKKEAEEIARRALVQMGLNEQQLGLCGRPQVVQEAYESQNSNDSVLFPHYHVTWRPAGSCDSEDSIWLKFEVSGITKSIAHFYNVSRLAPVEPLPKNYWEMLGRTDNKN